MLFKSYLTAVVKNKDNIDPINRDFFVPRSTLFLIPAAVIIGLIATVFALGLLDLIGLITNALFYARFSVRIVTPKNSNLGPVTILIPMLGGLIVGLISKFGSHMVRGHGIPEAVDKILNQRSKIPPKVALLKPLASAIAIGTGGPFGAEGPIIVTGGALGSIIGQMFNLTGVQRRSLLVAGASAGMVAVFGTPLSGILFGLEVMMFEFKPRSLILIVTSSSVALCLRQSLAGRGLLLKAPIFPMRQLLIHGSIVYLFALGVGITCGFAGILLCKSVSWFEALFEKLQGRVDSIFWPMMGGVVIGCGGYFDLRAMGVGYGTIDEVLLSKFTLGALLLLLGIKTVIWSIGLGSGTSGGILAPVMMIGASLGAILGHLIPVGSISLWALIGLSTVFVAASRAIFTSIIFPIELTGQFKALPVIIIAVATSYLISVVFLKRSVLTEKLGKRGYHFNLEMGSNRLDSIPVEWAMNKEVISFCMNNKVGDILKSIEQDPQHVAQKLFPVLGTDGKVEGTVSNETIFTVAANKVDEPLESIINRDFIKVDSRMSLSSVLNLLNINSGHFVPIIVNDLTGKLMGLLEPEQLIGMMAKLLSDENIDFDSIGPFKKRGNA